MLVRTYPPQTVQFIVTTDPPGSSNKRSHFWIPEDKKIHIYMDAPLYFTLLDSTIYYARSIRKNTRIIQSLSFIQGSASSSTPRKTEKELITA